MHHSAVNFSWEIPLGMARVVKVDVVSRWLEWIQWLDRKYDS